MPCSASCRRWPASATSWPSPRARAASASRPLQQILRSPGLRQGARVGLLDADIYGPSQPIMLGLTGQRPASPDGKRIKPLMAHGIAAMSIGFLIDPEQPMVWRGPMVTQALTQLLGDTDWGDLDYLVIDMPPGTGDIQLTLAQRVPVAGAVIVTTPQDIALADARKGLKMFEKVNVPVLGIVENMSVHVCTNCGHVEHLFGAGGGARMAAQYGVELLGELPLDARVREEADGGAPTVVARPDSPHAAPISRWRAARPPRWRAARRTARRCSRRSSSKRARQDEHQVRQLDPPHGGEGADDRAVRARAGARSADGHKIVSYGTSSYGYDVRCSREFKIFTNINSTIVDPKDFDEKSFVDVHGGRLHHPAELLRAGAHGRVLPHSAQRRWSSASGKSTYARCGIIVNVTPLEPEWEGHVTLEFSNTTPLPAKIYANEGVAQMLFFESDEVCSTSYKDRGGKYQGQKGVTLPKT